MRISTDPGVWISAFCTLGIMSFLYKDNRWFKIVENAFIGFGAAHALVLGYENIRDLAVRPIVKDGNLMPVIPLLLGLLLYTRFWKQTEWVARVPMGFLYGLGAAVAVRGTVISVVHTQVMATIRKLGSLNDVIIVVGVLATMSCFLFSFKQSGPFGKVQLAGRWFIMLAFGAGFGNTVMARMSTLIARLTFLWGDWLGLI